ncbi:GNAT family N-acetyltransferase [uncultured Dysgonomonas sp.]|uniref:Acetyltransferase, GNAT family n=1 Tax=uncultured Dysgonomonas sp. TaxID=206096 RepID=A0A212JG60_9BACT|nr:GNAT family N-acetyltransferase [uncultured Dysgonomonas sp.]SBV98245.1 Acetyltransferase, GNAT family [uncultured Dysgonomonas sp.]
MTEYFYDDTKKELPSYQLHRLFLLAGWSDGSESPEILDKFNLPFINSTLVISAWRDDRLLGVVRVLSDKTVRSVIYDLVIEPEFQRKGIGRELIKRCIQQYPKSEWLVQTEEDTAGFYEKMGFDRYKNSILRIPSKWFKKET